LTGSALWGFAAVQSAQRNKSANLRFIQIAQPKKPFVTAAFFKVLR
jgi:hypothetical protein